MRVLVLAVRALAAATALPRSARSAAGGDLAAQLVDGDGDLLEELVDLVGVVAAQAVAELDLPQDFGGQISMSADGIGTGR